MPQLLFGQEPILLRLAFGTASGTPKLIGEQGGPSLVGTFGRTGELFIYIFFGEMITHYLVLSRGADASTNG
jgi:hypothetical protein